MATALANMSLSLAASTTSVAASLSAAAAFHSLPTAVPTILPGPADTLPVAGNNDTPITDEIIALIEARSLVAAEDYPVAPENGWPGDTPPPPASILDGSEPQCHGCKVPSNPFARMTLHRELGLTENPAILSRGLHALSKSVIKLKRGDYNGTGVCPPGNVTDYQSMDPDLLALFSVEGAANDPTVSDVDYYTFSEKNLEESGVSDWYAIWSSVNIRRQRNTTANDEFEESKQFAIDFAQTRNFECNIGFGSCLDKPSLRDLQRLYPEFENRPLVRKIYYHFYQVDSWTRKVSAELDTMTNLNLHYQSVAPTYVELYTQQVDRKKAALCSFFRELTNTLVESVIQMGFMGCSNVFSHMLVPGGPLANLVLTEHTRAALVGVGPELNANGQALLASLKSPNSKGFGLGINAPIYKNMRFEYASTIYDLFPAWLQKYGRSEVEPFFQTHISDMGGQMINGGISHGVMCNEFEGNWENLNPENTQQLKNYLNKFFDVGREMMLYTFERMYRGTLQVPGESPDDVPVMSHLAKLFAQKKWHGPNGVLGQLNNRSGMEKMIKGKLHRELVGGILADGQNYIQCTKLDNAPGACAWAINGTEPFQQSIFCPKPVEEPTLICMAARHLTSTHGSHEVEFNGLHSLPNDPYFRTTLQYFYKEVYSYYEKFGNNFSFGSRAWVDSVIGVQEDDAPLVGRWHMPVCQSDDHLYFEDFNHGTSGVGGTGNSYHFPSTCGSFKSELTEQFMTQLSLGPDSNLFNFRAFDNTTNDLYRDRLMRNLHEIPPVNRYLALCAQSHHFPAHGDKYGAVHHIKRDSDIECPLVREAVDNMTEEEANMAFCRNTMGHSVFNRERGHLDIPNVPVIFNVPNHAKACGKYLRKPWTAKDLKGWL